MLAQEISIPVYFSKYDANLENIISDLSNMKTADQDDFADSMKDAGKRDSALSEIINSISANGYQVCVSICEKTTNSLFAMYLM